MKPGRREPKPSNEIARFTGREAERAVFLRCLHASDEQPVLMFYGVGGAGKSWLLKKLREETPVNLPVAALDFDTAALGQRFVSDPTAALQEIRQQLKAPAPHFDLAFAMLRFKQGAADEPGLHGEGALGPALEVASEIVQKTADYVPGMGTILNRLSRPLLKRLKGTPIESFLADATGGRFVLELRTKNAQEIANELLQYLADDLSATLPVSLHRAVRAVVFLDTFEAAGAGLGNTEHQRLREQWIRHLAANFPFALIVIAGQNRLNWDEAEPEWSGNIDQRLVGGLSASDARQYLRKCEIEEGALADAILAQACETETGGYHCFSLGLCADIVHARRRHGEEPAADTFHFTSQGWEDLARRFLKSLGSDGERRWIERLALTPRFDESAARAAFSKDLSAAGEAAWEALDEYSFVQRLAEPPGWLAIRAQMRWALENQPSAQARVQRDHDWWRAHWGLVSEDARDDAASLAWYHWHCVEPVAALTHWVELAVAARLSVPPRMSEHFDLLLWWNAVGLLDSPLSSPDAARACNDLGIELWSSSLGDRAANLRQAIACFEAALRIYTDHDYPRESAVTRNNLGTASQDLPTGDRAGNLSKAIACYEGALRIYTEQDFPQERAVTQNNLGNAWRRLPTGDRAANLGKAIACYEAALGICTEQDFPQDWAMTQNNLGNAWQKLPTGGRASNLSKAIACYEAALRIRTEQDLPLDWAATQNNLGVAWQDLPTGDRAANVSEAIACYEAALRIYTELDFPRDWAMTQNNLATASQDLPTGDRAENLSKAIACYEAALRIRTEHDFPQDWAMTQNNLGVAWQDLPTGDRAATVSEAIACYEAALRIRTEQDFPQDWAATQNNLGTAWHSLPTGDRAANLSKAIACLEAALRIYTEQDFPQDWAMTQNNLGNAWKNLPTGDRAANLSKAIACYESALRISTEQDLPQAWAMTQNNLGNAWCDLPTGDRAGNLSKAIACFEAALRIYTEQDFPEEHAACIANLKAAQDELNGLDDQ